MGKWDDPEYRRAYFKAYNAKRKEAQREYHKTYREAHRDELRAKDRAYAAAHREEARKRARDWYRANLERARLVRHAWREANRDEMREYSRAYRQRCWEALRAYDRARAKTEQRRQYYREWARRDALANYQRVRDWCRANPEKAKALRNRVAARRRARLAGVPFEDVDRDELYRHHDGLCGLCGKPVDRDTFTVDHIIPIAKGGGHVFANLHIAHRSCNARKGTSDADFLYSL